MNEINFVLQRYSNVLINGGSTQGNLLMRIAGAFFFFCHTLEDEQRDIKVIGETRIPAGKYELKIWNGGRNPNQWVLDHRIKYGAWFKFPIQLMDVPGFDGVLIHTGVDQSHTNGCILLDDTMGNNTIDTANQGGRSLQAVQRFYEKVYPILEQGGRAFIEIRDEYRLI
jgi:hypothetical protein